MNPPSGVTALVLAGGGRDDVCRDSPTAVNKAFVQVGGVALVTATLRALREAASISRIIVVAPADAPSEPLSLADERRLSGPTISESLANGLAGLPEHDFVLVVASDLPLLGPLAIDDFLARAQRPSADLLYGFLARKIHDAHYPQIRHTWARFREGIFCGTGLCAIRPRALPALLRLLNSVAAARKAPWRLASLLGPRILWRFALGILGLHETEARISAILGHPTRGVPTPYPESAINIDRYSDLQQCQQLLGGK